MRPELGLELDSVTLTLELVLPLPLPLPLALAPKPRLEMGTGLLNCEFGIEFTRLMSSDIGVDWREDLGAMV